MKDNMNMPTPPTLLELLPCPFCGCGAQRLESDPQDSRRHTIKCPDCPGRAEFFSSSTQQAIEAWNRRSALSAERAEVVRLKDDLQFVERWANHHGQKPYMTAEQVLGCIQHYPPIKAITSRYTDGKLPTTFDPYAEIERLREALFGDNGALTRMDMSRSWLTNDRPTTICNWGVLDTSDLRAALTPTQGEAK